MAAEESTEGAVTGHGRLSRLLAGIERVGNKLPHPFYLFLIIALLIMVISWIASLSGASTVDPVTGKTVAIKSLLSGEGVRYMTTSMITNFVEFPPFGLIITVMLGIGVAERVGLLDTFMRGAVLAAPRSLITVAVVVVSLMGNLASDSAMLILPPLAAAAFHAAGRHPLAGFVASYCAVSAGFSANLLIAGTDVLLAGITTKAAQIVDPSAQVSAVSNWYFMAASTVILGVVISITCQRFVEPRLGTYRGSAPAADAESQITAEKKRGLRWAGITAVVYLGLVVAAVWPASSPLRGQDGDLLRSPFLTGLPVFILLFFLATGIAYGVAAGTLKRPAEVPEMMIGAVRDLAPFMVMVFTAAQAIAYFNWTQLGLLIATEGAGTMRSAGLDGIWGLGLFSLFVIIPAMLLTSGSALWTLLAPVFVPMFMLNGVDPGYVQAAFRITDSATNTLVPMNPMLPAVLGLLQRWDRKAGLGTLFSLVIPFTVVILVVWLLFFIIWGLAGLPVGPGHGLMLPR